MFERVDNALMSSGLGQTSAFRPEDAEPHSFLSIHTRPTVSSLFKPVPDRGETDPTAESAVPKMTEPKVYQWRDLMSKDISQVVQIADKIHPGLPERHEVFAERLKVFPEGCLALVNTKSDELCGYLISHPIITYQPPPLDTLIGEIPPGADQYYIHDLAILPESRGGGRAKEAVAKVLDIAKQYPTTCLISVYGTSGFWGRFGFREPVLGDGLQRKVAVYGEDAVFLERKN